MKKVMMLLALCGVAQVQALTVKNSSDTTVKITINGNATGLLGYVLQPGESTPSIALKPGQVDYVKVDKFYDSGLLWSCGEFANIDDSDGYGIQRVKIECVGDRRGAVIKPGQLAIVRRDQYNVFNNNSVVVFSGSRTGGYTLTNSTPRR